MINFTIN